MISKTEIGGGKELPGCEMELYDEENNLIHSWISSDVAESLEEFLEPGKPTDWLKKPGTRIFLCGRYYLYRQ